MARGAMFNARVYESKYTHTGAADVVSYPSWRTAKRYEDWRAPFSKACSMYFSVMTSCLAPWLQPHVRSVPDRFVKRQGTSWLHTRRKKNKFLHIIVQYLFQRIGIESEQFC